MNFIDSSKKIFTLSKYSDYTTKKQQQNFKMKLIICINRVTLPYRRGDADPGALSGCVHYLIDCQSEDGTGDPEQHQLPVFTTRIAGSLEEEQFYKTNTGTALLSICRSSGKIL